MQDKVKKYQIVYADPPWDYKGQLQHTGQGGKDSGGATKHYGCMKLADLKKLDVPSLCDDDCLMFMWATSPHLDQAIELLKAWGFSWATVGFVKRCSQTNLNWKCLPEKPQRVGIYTATK
jgi:N6-adenosine-specific RNA methylase IME4